MGAPHSNGQLVLTSLSEGREEAPCATGGEAKSQGGKRCYATVISLSYGLERHLVSLRSRIAIMCPYTSACGP